MKAKIKTPIHKQKNFVPGLTALRRLQRYFPNVETVVDATEPILINVEQVDNRNARKKDSMGCALVQACKREKIADAAMVGMSFSYLIKGTVATRYKTANTTSREITTFDRHKMFMPGKGYRLSPVGPSAKLNRYKGKTIPGKDRPEPKKRTLALHRTEFVRKMPSVT